MGCQNCIFSPEVSTKTQLYKKIVIPKSFFGTCRETREIRTLGCLYVHVRNGTGNGEWIICPVTSSPPRTYRHRPPVDRSTSARTSNEHNITIVFKPLFPPRPPVLPVKHVQNVIFPQASAPRAPCVSAKTRCVCGGCEAWLL